MAAPKNTNIREQILIKTEELLKEKSFLEISLSDIAKAAKISKGTLYYYYTNKDDILLDVTGSFLKELFVRLIEWIEDDKKDTSLHRITGYLLTFGSLHGNGNLRIYLIAEAISGNLNVKAKLFTMYQSFVDYISDKLKKRAPDIDHAYAAWLLILVCDGLVIQNQIKNPNLNVEEFIAKTVSLIKSGRKTQLKQQD